MKKETLDELAKTNANYESGKNTNPSKEHFKLALKRAYIKGYEESEKHLYSEEEVLSLIRYLSDNNEFKKLFSISKDSAGYFLEQFKK
jgi:hypothetical protein